MHTSAAEDRVGCTPAGMEHRWGRRIVCSATVHLSAGAATGSGRIRDISMSGAFIETSFTPALNSPVQIAVHRDDGRMGPVKSGCVVRREPDGFALEWAETPSGCVCPQLDCTEPCALSHRHAH